MTKRRVTKKIVAPTPIATKPERMTSDMVDGISSFTSVDDTRKLYLNMPIRRLKKYHSTSDVTAFNPTIQDMVRPDRVFEFTPSPPPVDESSPEVEDTEFAWLKLPPVSDDEDIVVDIQ